MKTNKLKIIFLLPLIFAMSCEQELITLEPADPDTTNLEPNACPAGASPGTLSFTKFVAVGNSFVAGVQAGALFTEGQNNSLAAILNKQFECVGAPATFNQPTIGASLGWNLFVTQPIVTPTFDPTKAVLGRMLLQYNGAASPKPTPQAYAVGNLEALPNPSANPGFLYTGSKTALNNFGVAAIFLGQSLITQTGNWALAGTDPRFSPFYGRLAYPGGTSTIIGDAAAAGGSFFLFWLGLDDFFLHAAFGGDGTLAPLTNAVGGTPTDFDFQYAAAVGSLLASNTNLKGVVGNFPDIFKMPHFTAVSYNPIPLAQGNADALNAGFVGYNAAIEGLKNPGFAGAYGTAAELDARKVSFVAGNNKILLNDESILDLGGGFDALLSLGAINSTQRAQLVPFENCRQTTTADIVPLSTGSILGTPGSFGLRGLSEPVADRYVIIPTEKTAINNARTAYNTIVQGVATANTTKLALADVDGALNALVTSQVAFYNGLTITPNINPPTGIYSEDGAHFNTRGYAFISHAFINAINAKFGATIPLTNISQYKATALPIP